MFVCLFVRIKRERGGREGGGTIIYCAVDIMPVRQGLTTSTPRYAHPWMRRVFVCGQEVHSGSLAVACNAANGVHVIGKRPWLRLVFMSSVNVHGCAWCSCHRQNVTELK